MYNAYCNELPLLHKLINTPIYNKLVDKRHLVTKDINHEVINFIDDSTCIIGLKNHNNIKLYLEQYYRLLEGYYNANKLKLNSDKNKLLIINKPKLDRSLQNFSFRAGKDIVKCSTKIKILGTMIEKSLKMESEIGNLCKNLHNRVHNIRVLTKYTDFKTRLNFCNSFVIGK